jgi:hypothetical protein
MPQCDAEIASHFVYSPQSGTKIAPSKGEILPRTLARFSSLRYYEEYGADWRIIAEKWMRYVAVVISLVLLAYLVMEFNGRTAELNHLRGEREVVSARLESKQATKAALEGQIAYATSDAAAMKWAYENHMARTGDYVVVPVQALQVTPTPAPRPVVVTPEVSNVQRWLSLFIDSPEAEAR